MASRQQLREKIEETLKKANGEFVQTETMAKYAFGLRARPSKTDIKNLMNTISTMKKAGCPIVGLKGSGYKWEANGADGVVKIVPSTSANRDTPVQDAIEEKLKSAKGRFVAIDNLVKHVYGTKRTSACARKNIMKVISTMRKNGFPIVSSQGKGYKWPVNGTNYEWQDGDDAKFLDLRKAVVKDGLDRLQRSLKARKSHELLDAAERNEELEKEGTKISGEDPKLLTSFTPEELLTDKDRIKFALMEIEAATKTLNELLAKGDKNG